MYVIEDENLQENARLVGKYLNQQCNLLKFESELVGDVRGIGLFVGIELIDNKEKRTPATTAARWIVDRMKSYHHILVSSDGPDDNVVKLKPPMVFNMENADEFIFAFKECLIAVQNQEKRMSLPAANLICNLPSNIIHEAHDHLIKSV